MEWWKILSLAIWAIYVIAAILAVTGEKTGATSSQEDIEDTVIAVIFWPLFSLGLIWYGDELGEGLVGAKFGLISRASPGWAVAFMGWIFLSAPIIIPIVCWLCGI